MPGRIPLDAIRRCHDPEATVGPVAKFQNPVGLLNAATLSSTLRFIATPPTRM